MRSNSKVAKAAHINIRRTIEMKKSILTLTGAAMMVSSALWAQFGAPAGNNQNNQPNGQPGMQQGQVLNQAPKPAQTPVIPANPVAQNAQQVQKSKMDLKKVQKSEIKTLADIQKAEDHDLNSVRKDTSLSSSARQKAIAQIRAKYDQMRKDARLAANKAGKMDYKNEQKAKAKELKAEKSQTPVGQ